MRKSSRKPFHFLKDGIIAVLILVMGTLIAAKLDGINQERFAGRFSAVDGDTLAYDGKRLRLIGIDAPEMSQNCVSNGAEWPCGARAKDYLKMLLQTGAVECSGNDRDRYKRLLVRCSIGDKDIAGEMVAGGFAVTTEYFLFSSEQALAQARRAGIWAGTFENPRDWRREHKAADMDVPLAGVISLVRHVLGW
ncbi:thermonuclease family protein [Agrobacterium rosae]|uniref:thermonuclease family protein n=1 Tax=Agrobacterium rosae TaxID=1972867 RepID=UPI002A0D6FE1|nr:thermonuclease family protein [Agrobacterium rosae]MDX8313891.1 thermonuclease family protein [Agrobacterium rosae]